MAKLNLSETEPVHSERKLLEPVASLQSVSDADCPEKLDLVNKLYGCIPADVTFESPRDEFVSQL